MSNSKLKSLTWKYFWQQKWKEIKEPVKVISIILFFGFFAYCLGYSEEGNWQRIVLIIMLSIFVLTATLVLVGYTYYWLHDNWVQAKAKAKKELKIK